MKIRSSTVLPVTLQFFLFVALSTSTSAQKGCTVEPQPPQIAQYVNFFNDRQEQDLGDALAEVIESDMRISAPSGDDQLTRIGHRLLDTLPPSGVHYTFRIYESGEINAFSVAGGRVYVSRKLITAAGTEDDLAGVIAHEIGHIATHQSAIEMTRAFQARLGVAGVSDRADIFARIHKFFDTPPKAHEELRGEEKDELEADRIAVYAMARSGYDPESFATFFDKVAVNRGKTGNWFSDAFGITGGDSRRYRSALKVIASLPTECKEKHPANAESFQAWQKLVASSHVQLIASNTITDHAVKLDPPLRPSLWHVRFSPDGRYILAQDEAGIVIVDRTANKALFRIDAPDAKTAQFTPDSKGVVFHDSDLRIEQWSIAAGKRTSFHELVSYTGCSQTLLAPDGRTLLCVRVDDHRGSLRAGIQLIDVESGKPVFEKPDFYSAEGFAGGVFAWEMMTGMGPANTAVSPDGRYLFVCSGSHSIAFDLTSRTQIELGGKLKGMDRTPMAFVAPDQVALLSRSSNANEFKARILKFPEGQVLSETALPGPILESSSRPHSLIVWSNKDNIKCLFDLDTNKILAWNKFPAFDMADTFTASESTLGGVEIRKLGTQDSTHIPVPPGDLPPVRAGYISPDGRFIAISLTYRGAYWDSESGKQLRLIRPYTSAWISPDDQFYGMFSKYMNSDAQQIEISLTDNSSKMLGKLDGGRQYADYSLLFKPIGKDSDLLRHATLQVRRMGSDKDTWSRAFNLETPVCWPADSDRILLAWDLKTQEAQSETRSNPELQALAKSLADRKFGLYLEIVNSTTGDVLKKLVLPEGDLSHGWNDERNASVSGDYILVHGEHDNTSIYALNSGTKIGEFFGVPLAVNAKADRIAAVNRENEMIVVEESTGKELQRFTLGSPLRIARILDAPQRNLLVVTADQVVHRIAIQ